MRGFVMIGGMYWVGRRKGDRNAYVPLKIWRISETYAAITLDLMGTAVLCPVSRSLRNRAIVATKMRYSTYMISASAVRIAFLD